MPPIHAARSHSADHSEAGVKGAIDRDAKIAIVGAGPSGLSTAHFLRQHGFRNVTILERHNRVGGQCRTVTEHQLAFDLGATFVSPDFHEVKRLAREVGAELESFGGADGMTFDPANKSIRLRKLIEYFVGSTSWIDFLRFLGLCGRYVRKRFRLRRLFRDSDWSADVVERNDLKKSFARWLSDNGLIGLSRLFEIPLTAFGYGSLDELPAAYGLRYMTLRAFLATLLTVAPGSRFLPRALVCSCFRQGYQRFWERVAWDLDVRLNARIERIERRSDGIRITYSHSAGILDAEETTVDTAEFDYLVLTCPLTARELRDRIDFDAEELRLLDRVRTIRYAVVSYEVEGLPKTQPIVIHIPIPDRGLPMIMLRLHPDCESVAFSGRLAEGEPRDGEEQEFRRAVEDCISALGGRILPGESYYDVAPYFRHVGADDLSAGLLQEWGRKQGDRRTFYSGGLFDFDHVEGTIRAARRLIERCFVEGRRDSHARLTAPVI
ncbi:MAG: FAD-dependent oxidoreductase [Planctomycetia bacterium]|nr:FAD-dependent oxidoreductase [Planctomycetia bacterium]